MARDKLLKRFRPVLGPSGPKDKVMRAGKRVDAVNLDKAELQEQRIKVVRSP
ncbi:MAG: hypothetical protein AAFU49_22805 [Pseudomonadota bacterium]